MMLELIFEVETRDPKKKLDEQGKIYYISICVLIIGYRLDMKSVVQYQKLFYIIFIVLVFNIFFLIFILVRDYIVSPYLEVEE